MHKEVNEQYCVRVQSFQLELDKLRSVVRQENDGLEASDRRRFSYVNALKAIDVSNEKLGDVLQTLKELSK